MQSIKKGGEFPFLFGQIFFEVDISRGHPNKFSLNYLDIGYWMLVFGFWILVFGIKYSAAAVGWTAICGVFCGERPAQKYFAERGRLRNTLLREAGQRYFAEGGRLRNTLLREAGSEILC